MCGIVGYVGRQSAVPIIMQGLAKLEYRGYDSAGIAVWQDNRIKVEKTVGRLHRLAERLETNPLAGSIGMGQTRWATHGKPSDVNAHPHLDCSGKIAVIHNGIIENYMELKEMLLREGHKFASQTDTEVIPHLIEKLYEGDLETAVRKVLNMIEGSYALVIMHEDEPDKIVGARKDSPLIAGVGKGESFIASDIPAILEHTRDMIVLNHGEMVIISEEGVRVTDLEGNTVDKEIYHVTWDAEAAEKGGYPHFMLKEINEQPRAIRDTLAGRLDKTGSEIHLDEIILDPGFIKKLKKIFIVACGTAYHAGMVGKYLIEHLTRIPVEIDIASEFRYRDPIVDNPEEYLMIVVSQSGETADTLGALREMKRRGLRILAVTNVIGSSVARESDDVLLTRAGPEIAVASTKAYTTQLIGLYLLAIKMGQITGTLANEDVESMVAALRELPTLAQRVIDVNDSLIQELARTFSRCDDIFFIGRHMDYALALEGALKLKEISYIHAEAYAAGELKHGTLALITKDVPVIAIATQPDIYAKMVSNIQEVNAREATVIAIGSEGDADIGKHSHHTIYIPLTHKFFTTVLAVIPLQLFAYYAALERDCDVDKPRNLAKSVTVE
jgi:glutamine---fructose-6-phosphate transaminase (isomerizing)